MRKVLPFLIVISCSIVSAQDDKPQKYALLAAVREYDHPDMNQPLLQYPEVDAKSMNDLLKDAGYEVDLLLGKQATQDSIRKKLEGFKRKGGNKGVVVVGLFGHGIEFESTKKSFFCPYNTSVVVKRDGKGRPMSDENGKPRMEPDAETMIAIDEILLALRESKATNRILLADCCRNDPNAARGRSFGTNLKIDEIPINTAVLFACSAQERAYEHADWGHGAFTKCLLDSIKDNAGRGKSLMGSIAEDVGESVEKLVKSKVTASQTPFLLSTGTRIDLQLVSISKSPTQPSPSNPSTNSDVTTSRGFEGTKAGDRMELVSGIFFRWCPAGTFKMGSPKSEKGRNDDEDPVSVTLTKGFWLGETEVTQGQWQRLMGTSPWRGKNGIKVGDKYPAIYVSHDNAVEFCEKLTIEERGAKRLPSGWTYSLPTEAQWEYACRAGTGTKYFFGSKEVDLGEYAWFKTNTESAGESYAHPVGLKKANLWGFYDIYGNVSEWCSDWWQDKLQGGRDPHRSSSGWKRVLRGGNWRSYADDCRSTIRGKQPPDFEEDMLGFRLAAFRN